MKEDKINAVTRKALIEIFPDINWDRLYDANRALNWEVYWGPLPADYWTVSEPLEHYEWKGQMQAIKDIREMVSDLPSTVYYDGDAEWISLTDPEDDENNWVVDEDHEGIGEIAQWVGGDNWYEVNVLDAILRSEVRKLV